MSEQTRRPAWQQEGRDRVAGRCRFEKRACRVAGNCAALSLGQRDAAGPGGAIGLPDARADRLTVGAQGMSPPRATTLLGGAFGCAGAALDNRDMNA